MSNLSKLQVVVLGLVFEMKPFTEQDLARMQFWSVDIDKSPEEDADTKELHALVSVDFGSWGYRVQRKAPESNPNDVDTQAEFSFAFERDENMKLTGKVRGGFVDREDTLTATLPHIKGW